MEPLRVPHRRQAQSWSCGAACARSIEAFFGRRKSEADLIRELGTTPESGTNPKALVTYFRSRGFTVHAGCNQSRRSLASEIGKGRPVIVALQDWACCASCDLSTSLDHGHYAVAVGIDAEHIYLVDPASKKRLRKLPVPTFLERWRDIDSSGRVYRRWFLSVGRADK